MLSDRQHFLLGVMLTSLSVMLYREYTYTSPIIKTETIVHLVSDPIIRGNFELESNEINSSLNKSKLKHLLIYVNALCDEYGVDYGMVKAVIQTESNWNHRAISSVGAMGLMQILPETAMSEFNTHKNDLFDPYINVTVGIKYLSHLNNHFGDMESTLTAYSHGPTVTRKYSQNYIKNNFYVKRVYKNL